MSLTIIDCYTDEPAGLGVPPYLGTYPRYIFGKFIKDKPTYLTIDDIRLWSKYNSQIPKETQKTNIKIYNPTKNWNKVGQILKKTKTLIVILGVHVPGKYLTGIPGTLKEISSYINDLNCYKILTGPAATEHGTQVEGGKFAKHANVNKNDKTFDEVIPVLIESYEEINKVAVKGTEIINQIPSLRIAEIETGRGCTRKPGCSFCTEPYKHDIEFRDQKNIINEIKSLKKLGIEYFRLGKQSCFYSYKSDGLNSNSNEIEKLLKPIHALKPKVLHIDNANPQMVSTESTKLISKYCTEGNIAAFGVESFDPVVQKNNNLNCDNETVDFAIKLVNEIGAKRGPNGMSKFLPGINLLFGLNGESKKTFEYNYSYLQK